MASVFLVTKYEASYELDAAILMLKFPKECSGVIVQQVSAGGAAVC